MKKHPITLIVSSVQCDKIVLINGKHIQCVNKDHKDPLFTEIGCHQEQIRSACFSRDGSKLITAGDDKKLCVWDTFDWKKPTSVLTADQHIIVSDKFGDVYRFAFDHPKEELLLGCVSIITDIDFSHDQRYIISCDRDEKIRVSEYPKGYNIESYCLGHTEFVSTLCVYPLEPELLLSGGADKSLRLWNWMKGEQIHVLDLSTLHAKKEFAVSKIASSADGIICVIIEAVPMAFYFTIQDNKLHLLSKFDFESNPLSVEIVDNEFWFSFAESPFLRIFHIKDKSLSEIHQKGISSLDFFETKDICKLYPLESMRKDHNPPNKRKKKIESDVEEEIVKKIK